jgi:hypothetical protein
LEQLVTQRVKQVPPTAADGAPRKRGTEGAVMVEFLAVFFPLFSFFLGLVQLMFLQTAARQDPRADRLSRTRRH